MNRKGVIDAYFMEHRAKVLDIAAFFDRVDRAQYQSTPSEDFRMTAIRKAVEILLDVQPERARRILETFSDMTTDIPESAKGMKGAAGAAPEVKA
jgi:hypothetical protein